MKYFEIEFSEFKTAAANEVFTKNIWGDMGIVFKDENGYWFVLEEHKK